MSYNQKSPLHQITINFVVPCSVELYQSLYPIPQWDKESLYAIDNVQDCINCNSPLNAQLVSGAIDRARKGRYTIANKIISDFTKVIAAISVLPLIDIPITWKLTDLMCEFLECIAISEDRTYDSFVKTRVLANFGRACVTLGIGLTELALDASGVFVAFGVTLGVVSGAALTNKIGWDAYAYYVGEDRLTGDVADVLAHQKFLSTGSESDFTFNPSTFIDNFVN